MPPTDPLEKRWFGYAVVLAFLLSHALIYLTLSAVDGKLDTSAKWGLYLSDLALHIVLWLGATAILFRTAREAVGAEGTRWGLVVWTGLGVVLAMNLASVISEFGLLDANGFKGEPKPWSAFPEVLPLKFLAHLPIRMLYGGLFLAVGVGIETYRRFRARQRQALQLQGQLAEARLQALRSQLDPHFLFNALNTVSALVEREPATTRRVVARLSDLLRRSLDDRGDETAPLSKELDFAEGYLEVMQARFGDRLHVHLDADPEALGAAVPPFLLQPLIENAVKHGVAPTTGPGNVWVRAQREGRRLMLTVEDDGPGAPPVPEARSASDDAPSGTEREGVGLRNTRERLAVLYGEDARVTTGPRSEGGFRARIELPFQPAASP